MHYQTFTVELHYQLQALVFTTFLFFPIVIWLSLRTVRFNRFQVFITIVIAVLYEQRRHYVLLNDKLSIKKFNTYKLSV